MRKGYDSLLGIVQKTLQPNKLNPVTIVSANGKAESRLNNKLEALEKMVADSIGKLETEVNEGAAAGSETQNAKQVIENLKANIALLDTKLRETEKVVRGKDATIRTLEQNSAARIQDLESQVKTKDNLLVGRATEVSDLKTQLEVLKNGIKEMSSFFNQSEILATVKGQNNSTFSREGESKTGHGTPTATRFTGPTATAEVTDAAVEAVPPTFFNHVNCELS
jgi:chromosome segregation ATPase